MLPPQAALTHPTGHLAIDSSPLALGQDIACRIAAELQGMRHDNSPPAELLSMTAAPQLSAATGPAAAEGGNTPRLLSHHPVQVLPKVSTCKGVARINGREVECEVDTGASTCAITPDCLRHLNLVSLIDATPTKYLNADGQMAASKGKMPNLPLSLGGFETLVNPKVASALSYNVLIGNDVLTRARAVIDYKKGKMVTQGHPTLRQELDLHLRSPEDFRPAAAPLHAARDTPTEFPSCHDTALVRTRVPCTAADTTPCYPKVTPDGSYMAADKPKSAPSTDELLVTNVTGSPPPDPPLSLSKHTTQQNLAIQLCQSKNHSKNTQQAHKVLSQEVQKAPELCAAGEEKPEEDLTLLKSAAALLSSPQRPHPSSEEKARLLAAFGSAVSCQLPSSDGLTSSLSLHDTWSPTPGDQASCEGGDGAAGQGSLCRPRCLIWQQRPRNRATCNHT